MKFMAHLFMDISGIFCLETTTLSRLKLWIGQAIWKSPRLPKGIFIFREVRHCKDIKTTARLK